MNKRIVSLFKDGIIYHNPAFVQLLGMCAMLAITTTVTNAIGMGIAVTVVLTCSNVFISLLRKLIPGEVRIAAFVVIISGFVTAVEMVIKAFSPELDKSLGVFIPLIVVNCIILARAEAFASKNGVLLSAIDGLSMGLGYTAALILIATVREILGAGTFFGIRIFPSEYQPILMFVLPAGAFIVLGCLIAAVQKILSGKRNGGEK